MYRSCMIVENATEFCISESDSFLNRVKYYLFLKNVLFIKTQYKKTINEENISYVRYIIYAKLGELILFCNYTELFH